MVITSLPTLEIVTAAVADAAKSTVTLVKPVAAARLTVEEPAAFISIANISTPVDFSAYVVAAVATVLDTLSVAKSPPVNVTVESRLSAATVARMLPENPDASRVSIVAANVAVVNVEVVLPPVTVMSSTPAAKAPFTATSAPLAIARLNVHASHTYPAAVPSGLCC